MKPISNRWTPWFIATGVAVVALIFAMGFHGGGWGHVATLRPLAVGDVVLVD